MRNIKKLLIVFLTLALAFCLFACGGGDDPCKTHVDKNNDGKCDKCSETIEEQNPETSELTLIENGGAKFQIVYSSSNTTSAMISAITKLRTTLNDLDIDVVSVVEKSDNIQDCEVLIGNITTRGDKYKTDGHDYGMDGYVIKMVDSKVIINGGSDAALTDAIEEFTEDILGIDKDTEELTTATMVSNQNVEKIQDDYRITSLSVDGKNMKGYTIALNKSNNYHLEAAKAIQQTIYERTGYWFELVAENKASDTSVVIKAVAKDAVKGGFKISTNSKKQLVIECGYDNKLQDTIDEFLSDKIVAVKGDIDFKGTVYTDDISVVYYKDFGAKGNGVDDDFFAIKAAHDFANISGQTVKAENGKTYYIRETRKADVVMYISIKTNVDWGTAKFTIDDSDISIFDGTKRHKGWIFQVESDYTDFDVKDQTKLASLAGIGEGTTKLEGLDLPYPAMLTIYNDNHRVYRRYISGVETSSKPQHEVILVDKDGNIDESTPFMFDYAEVTKYTVHRTDVEPITIKGGIFTTIASSVNIYDKVTGTYPGDGYLERGIRIMRPYTVLDGVEHYVTGEIPLNEQTKENCGVAYSGFFFVENTNDVLLKDLVLTGRRCYAKLNAGEQGTYDFDASGANNIRLEGCIQSNFYMMASATMGVTTTYKQTNSDGSITYGVEADINGAKQKMPGFTVTKDANGIPTVTPVKGAVLSMSINPKLNETGTRICWGIGGSNFCKNMEYINSVLSRFDAHCGLLNGKVVGTTINYFALVGKGDFLIEDVTWISATANENYQTDNSFIYLRGDYGSPWEGTITIKDTIAHNAGRSVWFMYHNYVNHDFGYTCYFPNIVIDNLKFTNADTVKFLYQSNWKDDIHKEMCKGEENTNIIVPPEFIEIKNNTSKHKYNFPDIDFFKNTDLSKCEGSIVKQ